MSRSMSSVWLHVYLLQPDHLSDCMDITGKCATDSPAASHCQLHMLATAHAGVTNQPHAQLYMTQPYCEMYKESLPRSQPLSTNHSWTLPWASQTLLVCPGCTGSTSLHRGTHNANSVRQVPSFRTTSQCMLVLSWQFMAHTSCR